MNLGVRIAAVLLCAVVFPASAQAVRSHIAKPVPRVPAAKAAPYNSTGRDTTPMNCEQYRKHPHPGMLGFCEGMENMVVQGEARRQGRPMPSTNVVQLPGLGTPEAKQLGYACVGGAAMKKIPNGWEQVIGADGWQRCTGG